MKSYFLSLLLLLPVLDSCQAAVPPDGTAPAPANVPAAVATDSPRVAGVAPASTDDLAATKKLLEGRWQSAEDKKSVVEFRDGKMIDRYETEEVSVEPFTIRHPLPEDRALSTRPEDILLFAGDLSWIVDYVDHKNLTLIYTALGNTLSYQRIRK